MRTVAIALALLVLPLASVQAAPDEPYDECGTVQHNKPCHDLEVVSPAPQAPVSKRYFLWLGVVKCPQPTTQDCQGRPNGDHKTPTPVVTGAPGNVDYPYSAVMGILYEDTNRLGGLQRLGAWLPDGTFVPPDRMVLV